MWRIALTTLGRRRGRGVVPRDGGAPGSTGTAGATARTERRAAARTRGRLGGGVGASGVTPRGWCWDDAARGLAGLLFPICGCDGVSLVLVVGRGSR